MAFRVTILGNNSAIPAYGRHPTSQFLQHDSSYYLIDCGEGTQFQLKKYDLKFSRINHIFISHLHGDHIFGLIGLINTFHLSGRKKDLHIFAPEPLSKLINIQLNHSGKIDLKYKLVFHILDANKIGQPIYENDQLTVQIIEMDHKIECYGFIFKEKTKQRKLLIDEIKKHNIPVAFYKKLQQGEDYVWAGQTISNGSLTADPPAPKTYAFCSDTKYNEKIISSIRKADLLYHEATFGETDKEKAAEKNHSTAIEAATIAHKANVDKLIVGHFSAKYKDLTPLLKEAQSVFKNTMLAEEGVTFEV